MDNNESPQSVISNDIEIIGTIKGTGSVRIDGKLEGELHCGGDAVIGPSAQITGNIVVNSVSIEGSVQGNVTAKDRIEIKAKTELFGDIRAAKLAIEEGVTFEGKTEVNPKKVAPIIPTQPPSSEGAKTAHPVKPGAS